LLSSAGACAGWFQASSSRVSISKSHNPPGIDAEPAPTAGNEVRLGFHIPTSYATPRILGIQFERRAYAKAVFFGRENGSFGRESWSHDRTSGTAGAGGSGR